MDEDASLEGTNELEAILRTLENFDVIPAGETGAVLYSHRQATSELPQNLRTATAASALGLTSLDGVKRRYPMDGADFDRRPVVRAYMDAIAAARAHIGSAGNELAARDEPRNGLVVPIGVLASSVALQRLESGFLATHLLYRLGLNLEGDAVARQILEQIAWANGAFRLSTLKSIEALEPQTTIGAIKHVLPQTGRLYGELSKVAHAGIAVHRTVVDREGDRGVILFAQEKLSRAARIVLSLADAWVVVFEVTQGDYVENYRALHSRKNRTPNLGRRFVLESARAVAEIEALELEEGSSANSGVGHDNR